MLRPYMLRSYTLVGHDHILPLDPNLCSLSDEIQDLGALASIVSGERSRGDVTTAHLRQLAQEPREEQRD